MGTTSLFPGLVALGNQYGKYYCFKTTLRLKMWNPTTTDFMIVVVASKSSSITFPGVGDEEALWSLPKAKSCVLIRGSMNANQSVKNMTYTMTTKKMFPDADTSGETEYSGNFGPLILNVGNPVTMWYIHVLIMTPSGQVIPNLAGVQFEAQLTQHIRLTSVRAQ